MHRAEITALLKPWFRAHRVEDFARSFDEHGVTWSVFRSFKRVVEEDPEACLREANAEHPALVSSSFVPLFGTERCARRGFVRGRATNPSRLATSRRRKA